VKAEDRGPSESGVFDPSRFLFDVDDVVERSPLVVFGNVGTLVGHVADKPSSSLDSLTNLLIISGVFEHFDIIVLQLRKELNLFNV
jgi:hypothetical protein